MATRSRGKSIQRRSAARGKKQVAPERERLTSGEFRSGPGMGGALHGPSIGAVQADMRVTKSGDSHEREADRMADQVVNGRANRGPSSRPLAASIQPLQRKGGGPGATVSPAVEGAISSAKGGGRPLDGATRGKMEAGFGADFKGVRVHTDSKAAKTADSLGANAFTVGNDIFFNQGQFNPGTQAGQKLIAHELTHTIQQKGGGAAAQRQVIQREKKPGPFKPSNYGILSYRVAMTTGGPGSASGEFSLNTKTSQAWLSTLAGVDKSFNKTLEVLAFMAMHLEGNPKSAMRRVRDAMGGGARGINPLKKRQWALEHLSIGAVAPGTQAAQELLLAMFMKGSFDLLGKSAHYKVGPLTLAKPGLGTNAAVASLISQFTQRHIAQVVDKFTTDQRPLSGDERKAIGDFSAKVFNARGDKKPREIALKTNVAAMKAMGKMAHAIRKGDEVTSGLAEQKLENIGFIMGGVLEGAAAKKDAAKKQLGTIWDRTAIAVGIVGSAKTFGTAATVIVTTASIMKEPVIDALAKAVPAQQIKRNLFSKYMSHTGEIAASVGLNPAQTSKFTRRVRSAMSSLKS